jgi:RecB family exonuclease
LDYQSFGQLDYKTFAASIAQTLVDKQVQFQMLSYKLGLGKSLTGLGLKKFKKPWAVRLYCHIEDI